MYYGFCLIDVLFGYLFGFANVLEVEPIKVGKSTVPASDREISAAYR